MARRNPAGGIGLGTVLLLLGGGLVAAKILAGGSKKNAGTGWAINGTCTQADLVDVALAQQDAIKFASAWTTQPRNKMEAEDRLRLYFSSRFPACTPASPPETFWDINGNTYFWAGVVAYAWGDFLNEAAAAGAMIPEIVRTIVGGRVNA